MIFGKWSFSLCEITRRPLFVNFRALLQKFNFFLQLFNQFLEFGVFSAQPGYLGVHFYLHVQHLCNSGGFVQRPNGAWAATLAAKRSKKETVPIDIFIRLPFAIHTLSRHLIFSLIRRLIAGIYAMHSCFLLDFC